MIAGFSRQIEAIVFRALPGVANLFSVLLLGDWLSPADYGLFSTVIATTGFVASFGLGPATFGIIYQLPKWRERGLAKEYESSIFALILMAAGAVSGIGAVGALTGLVDPSWIAATVSFGVYTAFQELLRAKVRLRAYALASLLQSALFVTLSWTFVRTSPSLAAAIYCFSVSYAAASLISMSLTGWPRLRFPDWALLNDSIHTGSRYTFANLIEQGLYLGVRYIVLLLGGAQMLGPFSFCADLAQRVVGFLISASTFVTVPLAFQADAKGDTAGFSSALRQGSIFSSFFCVGAIIATILIGETGLIPALSSDLFEPWAFTILAVASAINRLKKMVIDSHAVRGGRASLIAWGYAVGAPVAIFLSVLMVGSEIRYGAELSYFAGYLSAAIVTILMLRRGIRRSTKVS